MPFPEIRYVSKVGRDAWLRIRLDAGAGEISLPQYLKVNVTGRTANRDTFEILEGAYKGRTGSVSAKSPSESYFITGVSHTAGGKVKFSLGSQKIWFGAKGPYSAFSGAFSAPGHVYTKIPIGSYKLAIPDAPHSATRSAYYAHTDYHKTWFRVGVDLSGSRFLHVGEISEGCVTMRAFQFDPAATPPPGFEDLPSLPLGAVGLPYPASPAAVGRWTDLYEYLIVARSGDQSVGDLEVIA